MHAQRHHHGLAQRVDRRIGDLGEPLAEIGVHALRRAGQGRNGRVVAHAPHRIDPGGRHGLEHQAKVLEAIAEETLAHDQFIPGRCGQRTDRVRHQHRHVASHPGLVRVAPCHVALGVEVSDDLPAHQVRHQYFARPDLAGLDHFFRFEVDQAHLGADHDESIVEDLVAARTQAVAIDGGTGEAAVGVCQCSGPIPRFMQALVVLVEGADRRIHVGILLPCLRDHHHAGVHRIAARAHKELHGVVQARGVAAMRPDDVLEPVLASFPQW